MKSSCYGKYAMLRNKAIFNQINSRTNQSYLLGRPIVHLCKPTEYEVSVDFTSTGLILYNAVDRRFAQISNMSFETCPGSPLEPFQYLVHQILRLRQYAKSLGYHDNPLILTDWHLMFSASPESSRYGSHLVQRSQANISVDYF